MAISEAQMRRRWGAAMLVIGVVYPLLWLFLGPVEPHAWVIGAVAALFLTCGLLCFTSGRGIAADVLAGIVFLLMSSLGFFAAISPGKIESKSSGIFVALNLLSNAQNQALGRGMFALGAALSMGFGIFMLGRSFLSWRSRD
jgi:hypothetical protein